MTTIDSQSLKAQPLKPQLLKPLPLKPESLPLTGIHLIEASAGTGKTYNITRIYLRLLLERQLDVRNILVMTFTRAATEELRGRIAQEIRNALENWGQFDPNDSFFSILSQRFDKNDVYPVLHNALLHLDEAAIFTIHAFCKRILSQQAFSSGIAFNVQMEADTLEIELEAVRDWYRQLAQDKERYPVLTNKWLTPESFRQAFREILSSTIKVNVNTPDSILSDYYQQKNNCVLHLQSHQAFIFSQLVDSNKKKDERAEEWQQLLLWLQDNDDNTIGPMPRSVSQFFSGSRFPKKDPVIKQQLVDTFAPLNQLKSTANGIVKMIQNARAYQLAYEGIESIRSRIIEAKQRARVMNYDDLISQMAISLNPEQSDSYFQLAQQIRNQYPVALVDEFQDTDPQQYAILKAVYGSDSRSESSDKSEQPNTNSVNNNSEPDTSESIILEQKRQALYMIGDPKQAIYAFRSGDVFTYLTAREDAQYHWVMDTNWRSSSMMVKAYNRLFYGAPVNEAAQDVFGFDIQYVPVNASGKAEKKPLIGSEHNGALQFVYFPFNEDYQAKNSKAQEMKQEFCPVIASWCSHEVHRLLTSKTTKLGDRLLQEQDIAILVRDKTEASYIQDALHNAGYPSVYLSTRENVFYSEEAIELEQVLFAILELEKDRALIAGLSSRFFNGDTQQLYALQDDEEAWEICREQVFELRETWIKRGFMAMALKLLHQNYVPAPHQHERSLTNTIQLLELLQQASQRHHQPEQLLNWFREQINSQSANAEAELRLESDANLIRIVTQHGSKGLEYPVVFIPFATRYKDPVKFGSQNIDLFKYHERQNRELNYFIGQNRQISDWYSEEAWAETIRLLYVAITRAEYRCYVCAAPFSQSYRSPLGQTLKLQSGEDFYNIINVLTLSEPDAIQLRQVSEVEFSFEHIANSDAENKLAPVDFHGRIERNWWLSSFSALTRNIRHGGISSPDRDQDDLKQIINQEKTDKIDLRFTLPKGAAAGNLLHDILEHTDFSQPQWARSLERPLARFSEPFDQAKSNELISWLESSLKTTLDADSGLSLSQLKWHHTLRETEFYFPMEQVKPGQLGELLKQHRSTRSSFQLPGYQSLQGMMHGFIDLIFQWQGRYYVADYKSTHLGDELSCYDHISIEKNMRDNFYDLQYLLYSLALHRYLKFRIDDYDPQQHFGGVYYLYLRGMDMNSGQGVYYTEIKSDLLNTLDQLFSNQLDKLMEKVG